MIMRSELRKLALTAHITTSVGWLGSVAAFPGIGRRRTGEWRRRGRPSRIRQHAPDDVFVIVPFCLASFATGLVEGLGTSWGLFRHYWVLVKLLLTSFATFLLSHTQPIDHVASIAMRTRFDMALTRARALVPARGFRDARHTP